MRRAATAGLIALAACRFDPSARATDGGGGGGGGGDGGGGGGGSDGGAIDSPGSPIDGPRAIDAPAGPFCLGSGGLFRDCNVSGSAAPIMITTGMGLTTGDSSGNGNTACDRVVPATQGSGNVCVIEGSSLTLVAGETVIITGAIPVAYVITGDVHIDGTLDVSSHRGVLGPGADAAACGSGTAAVTDSGGGGGGAGGTFGTLGGPGGTGNSTPADAGGKAAPITARVGLDGGCRGGGGAAGSAPSLGGEGGGVVYIIASGFIDVSSAGKILANGAGGAGAPHESGGGGGGAGGLIGFHSHMISIEGLLAANGGGGGGGGNSTTNGGNGSDGAAGKGGAAGGAGGNQGAGGAGSVGSGAGSPGMTGVGGGGGGGGGAGVIYVAGAQIDGGSDVSPPPSGPGSAAPAP